MRLKKVAVVRRMQERTAAGERSIVRVLNDCQPVRILHMQYDKTMLLF